jgi:precorrin-4/cobalt-precorrin-4 C11-methyltransferase
MKVYFIGAGPGDPELITIKGLKVIQRSGYCIYAGSLVNPELLKSLPAHAKVYDSSRMSLEDMVVVYKEAMKHNMDVARIHSGDPSIYGAIQEQMHALDELGIIYETIPGVSSFVAAAAVLRQELTLPGVTQTIVITRMEGKTPIPEKEHLSVLATATPTLCIFLSIDKSQRYSCPTMERIVQWPSSIRQHGPTRKLFIRSCRILRKRLSVRILKKRRLLLSDGRWKNNLQGQYSIVRAEYLHSLLVIT